MSPLFHTAHFFSISNNTVAYSKSKVGPCGSTFSYNKPSSFYSTCTSAHLLFTKSSTKFIILKVFGQSFKQTTGMNPFVSIKWIARNDTQKRLALPISTLIESDQTSVRPENQLTVHIPGILMIINHSSRSVLCKKLSDVPGKGHYLPPKRNNRRKETICWPELKHDCIFPVSYQLIRINATKHPHMVDKRRSFY